MHNSVTVGGQGFVLSSLCAYPSKVVILLLLCGVKGSGRENGISVPSSNLHRKNLDPHLHLSRYLNKTLLVCQDD